MSNPDSFIDEVAEEVRKEKLFGYLRRYGWIGVVAVLGIVGGAIWTEWSAAQDRARAQAFGDALLAGVQDDTPGTLADVQASGAQGAVLRLLISAEALAAEDRPAALAALDALAADAALPATYRALAALKRVSIGAADIPVEDRRAVLAPLAEPGHPFRPLALEQLALIAVETGDTAAALALLRELAEDSETTPSLRSRAQQVITALGGAAEPA